MIVKIVNVVVSCKIKKINVSEIIDLVNCQYVPSRFAAAVVQTENIVKSSNPMRKTKSKKINVNVYNSAITSTGAEKPGEAISAIIDTVRKINLKKKCIEFLTKPQVSNMTVVAYLQSDSERITPKVLDRFEKMPFFSQLKGTDKKCTIMVSKSGTMTVTGAKSLDEAICSIKRVCNSSSW